MVRSTRGQRVTPLTEEQIAQDEAFWGDLLKEEEEDPDFEEEEGDDDDEDISDEIEEELSSEDEEAIKIDKAKEKKQTKGLYKDPNQKKKSTKKTKGTTDKPSFFKVLGDVEYDASKVVEEDEETKRANKKIKKTTSPPKTPLSAPLSPTTSRKSLRASALATIERNNEMMQEERENKKKLQSKQKKKPKKQQRSLTQKEKLEEAKKTELINIESLNNLMRLEEDRKKSQIQKKQIIEGPRTIFSSNASNGTTITFTDGHLPPPINAIHQQFYIGELKMVVSEREKQNKCVITGLPPKYIDPHTFQAFANADAYQILKEKGVPPTKEVYQSNNAPLRISESSITTTQDQRKRTVKRKSATISSSTPDMLPIV